MAYPSGSGSERIGSFYINNQTDDTTTGRWDGTDPTMGTETYVVPTNVIITVLNIIVAEQSNAVRSFTMYVVHESITNYLCNALPFTAYGPALIWNDKIILHPADKLGMYGSSSSAFDIHCTYLYQDYT